jgi:hypothetical protein
MLWLKVNTSAINFWMLSLQPIFCLNKKKVLILFKQKSWTHKHKKSYKTIQQTSLRILSINIQELVLLNPTLHS